MDILDLISSEEKSRRQEIEKRAPSRERLKAIIDRLPSHDHWLNDEYDWDLDEKDFDSQPRAE